MIIIIADHTSPNFRCPLYVTDEDEYGYHCLSKPLTEDGGTVRPVFVRHENAQRVPTTHGEAIQYIQDLCSANEIQVCISQDEIQVQFADGNINHIPFSATPNEIEWLIENNVEDDETQ